MFACTIPVSGKHIYEPSIQMRNRGGIAACGLVQEDFGVAQKILDEDCILQVALLNPGAKGAITLLNSYDYLKKPVWCSHP